MTLSRIRVALVIPLAFGCAHAVYDGQDYEDSSQTDELPMTSAGSSSVITSLPDKGNGSAGASSEGGAVSAGADSNGMGGFSAGSTGSAGAAVGGALGVASSGAGGTVGVAGAPTVAGGSTSSAGSSSGGTTSTAGAASGGTTASAGAASAGAPSAGSTSASCSNLPTWKLGTYAAGDKVQAAGKVYQCKPHPETGWCGVSDQYAPAQGTYWSEAWILVGPC